MRNMVTRTVHGSEVKIKVVDKTTEQIVEDVVILDKPYNDAEKLKKAVSKALDDSKILVSIIETTVIDKCYGIPTSKFMKLAVELDPKSRAKIEAEEATEAVSEN
jgi:hypothetical protein